MTKKQSKAQLKTLIMWPYIPPLLMSVHRQSNLWCRKNQIKETILCKSSVNQQNQCHTICCSFLFLIVFVSAIFCQPSFHSTERALNPALQILYYTVCYWWLRFYNLYGSWKKQVSSFQNSSFDIFGNAFSIVTMINKVKYI